MALVFPRAMPAQGARSSYFELQRVDYASPEVGGAGGGVTAGPARWSGKWTLADATDGIAIQWRAWASSLRGLQRTFIGRDMDRPWPVYFRGGLPDGWDGGLGSWSQTITADGQAILSVTGLYGGMGVGAGDYVDFRWTGFRRNRAALPGEVGRGCAVERRSRQLRRRAARAAPHTPERDGLHEQAGVRLMRLDT